MKKKIIPRIINGGTGITYWRECDRMSEAGKGGER